MTEQKEMMIDTKEQRFRLIKDGKPIGYGIIATIYYDGFHGTMYATDLQGNILDEVPDFDSFNLSFKFGDQWIFEGDKVEIKYLSDGEWTIDKNVIVDYQDIWGFRVGNKCFGRISVIDGLKVIGNIYGAENE